MTPLEIAAVVAMVAAFDVAHGTFRGLSRTRAMMLGPLGMLAYAWARARRW